MGNLKAAGLMMDRCVGEIRVRGRDVNQGVCWGIIALFRWGLNSNDAIGGRLGARDKWAGDKLRGPEPLKACPFSAFR